MITHLRDSAYHEIGLHGMRRFARFSGFGRRQKNSASAIGGNGLVRVRLHNFGRSKPPFYRPLISRGSQMINSGNIANTSIPKVMIHTNGQEAR